MAPFKKPVILDNDVISRLYSAGALRRALEVWPKRSFYITQQVIDEARKWPAKGEDLTALLEDLTASENLVSISIDDSSEEIWTYARLQLEKKLGWGESACIAIAHHRGFGIATDDEIARDVCKAVCPSVCIFGTGDLLNIAVRNGLMTQGEVNFIQTKIRRKSKQ